MPTEHQQRLEDRRTSERKLTAIERQADALERIADALEPIAEYLKTPQRIVLGPNQDPPQRKEL